MKLPPGLVADWPSISELLDEALALPRAERERWLQSQTTLRPEVRDSLRGLLSIEAAAESQALFESLPPIEGLPPPAPELAPDDIVGPYRVLRELGTGGMGAVWLAERVDGVLKRQIALKLPRLAWIPGLAERMARERDILSSLEHPNIARLYDAGLDHKGRPFLALEYVQGQRLDEYCDRSGLDLRARITLFLQVLDAVRYAHSHLVIHRDLKPANVLVNARGQAQLLDFGIARLQDTPAEKIVTDIGARAMTLRYASPEQVQSRPLSIASDVYSLGVMLYELLTGRSPYVTRKNSSAEIETAIVDAQLRLASRARIEPEVAAQRHSTPAKISRALRGDLDAVLLRAMARDVHERYSSVDAFHQDLTHWLAGEPVAAQPASRTYVLSKFVARHRWSVAFGTAAILTIVAVGIVAVLLAIEAREESRKALAARDFMLDLFEQANPELHGGRDMTARQLLLDSETQMRANLATQPLLRAELLLTVAALWERLGDPQRAREAMERRAEAMDGSGDTLGFVAARIDEATRAIAAGDVAHARKLLQQLPASADDVSLPRSSRIDWRLNRGWIALDAGALVDAERNFATALELARQDGNVDRQLIALFGRIRSAWLRGDLEASRREQRAASTLLLDPQLTPSSRIGRGTELMGWAYRLGDFRAAWPTLQKLVVESARVYGPYASSQQTLHLHWLKFAWRMQQTAEVLDWLRADAARAAVPPSRVEDRIERRIVEAAVFGFADRGADARAVLDAAWRDLDALPREADNRLRFRRRLALAEAAAALHARDISAAAPWVSDGLWNGDRDAATPTAAESPNALLAYRWFAMGWVAEAVGQRAVAADLLARACDTAERAAGMGPDHPDTALLRLNQLLFEIRNNKGDSSRNGQYLNRTEVLLDQVRKSFPERHTAVRKLRWLSDRLHAAPNRSPLAGVSEAMATEVSEPERIF